MDPPDTDPAQLVWCPRCGWWGTLRDAVYELYKVARCPRCSEPLDSRPPEATDARTDLR